MCGILMTMGQSYSGFSNALELMEHRGPDAKKVEIFDTKNGTLTLGHVRLSIHDLDARSEQPFISKCKKYVLIFNGEIYNFTELKKSFLPDEQFLTSSDTEVLLLLLIKYGEKILNDLDGMFAFCFYNKIENSILIARDQLGIKPLYYIVNNDGIFFSSESWFPYSISNKKLNYFACKYYFQFGFTPKYITLIAYVKKVLPSHILSYNFINNKI